ncbi:hypothetical protein [Nocardiopsis alba]|uniref:hypothetical protein n=1 Tax=Nocardiopsis alba TaxID=53437 RepID=UPI0035DE8ABB
MRSWGRREWTVASAGTVATLLLLGVPAVLVPNGLFSREVDPTWWSYPVWAAASILTGLVAATYVRGAAGPAAEGADRGRGKGIVGAALAWFAIGCPVCNKLVLLALGANGAMTWFAPLQPLLAVAGLALSAWALAVRLRAAESCPLPTP